MSSRDDVRARSVSGNKSDREMDSDDMESGGYEKGAKSNGATAFPTQGPAVRRCDDAATPPPHPCTHVTCNSCIAIAHSPRACGGAVRSA